MLWPGQITKIKLGPRYAWHNNECTWVSVPKNANMMFRKFCTHIGMEKVLLNETAPITVAVIRNPKTRLVSGICEHMRRKQRNILERDITSELHSFYRKPQLFDEHLEPQHVWIHGLTITHYIKFENMLEDIMRVPYMNQHTDYFYKMVRVNRLTSSNRYIDLPGFVIKYSDLLDEFVEKFYQQDLNLYNNLQSYENKLIEIRKEDSSAEQ